MTTNHDASLHPNVGSEPARPLKVAMLGTRHVHAGGVAEGLQALGHTVISAYERDAPAAKEWAAAGLCRTVDSVEAALEGADAAVVMGTNAERVDDVLAALDRGLPVLGEKPVACDERSLERLVAHADATRYMVALPVRFCEPMRLAREAIASGSIGTPIAGRGTNHGQYPGGWFGSLAEAGGGAVMDHVVHVGDGMCWLLGGDRITRVYAEGSSRMHDLPVEDCGVLTMDFASGFFASLDASWSRPESFHTWGDVWIEVVGTEGRLIIDPMAQHLQLFDDGAGKLRTIGYGDDMGAVMLDAFARFATHDGDSPVSLDEGAHASATVFAAYASMRSHHAEPVREHALEEVH